MPTSTLRSGFLFDNLYGEKKLISAAQEAHIIADLEAMLAKLSVVGEPNYFDPFGAQAAAERLARHYKKQGDTANVERGSKDIRRSIQNSCNWGKPDACDGMVAAGYRKIRAGRNER